MKCCGINGHFLHFGAQTEEITVQRFISVITQTKISPIHYMHAGKTYIYLSYFFLICSLIFAVLAYTVLDYIWQATEGVQTVLERLL